jgi:tRNA threonylcarbamoyl adenosine modification protein YjeE
MNAAPLSSPARIPDPEAMEAVGRRLGAVLRAGDVLVLTGELGAGKTTLARGIGEGMGVREAVTSPTFVLASTHPAAGGVPLVHVDAYRLHDALELDDLGLEPAEAVTVMEWGAPFVSALADAWCELVIVRRPGGPADDAPLDAPEERLAEVRDHGAPQLAVRVSAALAEALRSTGDAAEEAS